jgi:hypothetical protein
VRFLLLKMAVKLYRFQPHAQIKLEPWLSSARSIALATDASLSSSGDRRRRDADAWEGPMAGLVGDIPLEKQLPTAARLRY